MLAPSEPMTGTCSAMLSITVLGRLSHLDGSTAVQTVVELSADMRRWNPFEISLREVDN